MLAGGLAGCSSDSSSTLKLFQKTVSSKPPPTDTYPLSAAQIHDLPYATLGVRIGSGNSAVVVLATINGQNLRWVSADRVVFVTDCGWLMQTHGLPRDLAATRWLGDPAQDPLQAFARTGALPPKGVYRQIDLLRADESGIAVESRFEFRGEETVTIQGRRYACRRVDEIANMRAWRWETRNSFWLDAQSSQVWRSVQRYCPEVAAMTLEVLKPVAAG